MAMFRRIATIRKGNVMFIRSLAAVMFALSLTTLAVAESATTFETGVVRVRQSGAVRVVVNPGQQDRRVYDPVNGEALLRAGRIGPGQLVRIKITTDNGKKHKHRGHVTILK